MDAIGRKKLRVLVLFTVASALLGMTIGFLFVAIGEPSDWPPRLGTIIGAMLGLGIGVSEEFIVPTAGRTWSYFGLTSYRLLLYSGMVAGLILAANAALNSVNLGVSLSTGVELYLAEDVYLRDLAFAAAAAVLAIVGLQLSKLYRPRELGQLLTGKYYHPREEERVVSFVDIVGSTAIVERLGPLDASRCREVGATCLVSGDCIRQMGLPGGLQTRDLGVVELRGREELVRCHEVRLSGVPAPERVAT